jgi:hypothetical protein
MYRHAKPYFAIPPVCVCLLQISPVQLTCGSIQKANDASHVGFFLFDVLQTCQLSLGKQLLQVCTTRSLFLPARKDCSHGCPSVLCHKQPEFRLQQYQCTQCKCRATEVRSAADHSCSLLESTHSNRVPRQRSQVGQTSGRRSTHPTPSILLISTLLSGAGFDRGPQNQ